MLGSTYIILFEKFALFANLFDAAVPISLPSSKSMMGRDEIKIVM